jgi:hypothetical protein
MGALIWLLPVHHIGNIENIQKLTRYLELNSRYSTSPNGIETMLGIRKDMEVSEDKLLIKIKSKLSEDTILRI